MSGGSACKCPVPDKSNWFVYQRECNHSAFSGYHRTPSSYSSVGCRICKQAWRTKAKYVKTLEDAQR